MKMAEDRSDIGALWKKESRDGQKYLSGVVKLEDGTTVRIVVFSNRYKKSENQPDFRIYRSREKEGS